MSIFKEINNKIVQSMKNKAADNLAAFKQIKTFLVKEQKDERKDENDDSFAIASLQKFIKQKEKIIQSYIEIREKANVEHHISEESLEKQLAISLLPGDLQLILTAKTLSEEELKDIIKSIIEEKGYSSLQDRGLVMKDLKGLPGVDMKLASGLVESYFKNKAL